MTGGAAAWAEGDSRSAHEHPATAADRADAFGADASSDPDDEGVAAPGAEVCDPGAPGQLRSTQYSAGVLGEDLEHGPLLRCQILEGVRIFQDIQ